MSVCLEEKCHDCGVAVGEPHLERCDVELCTVCGGQRMLCDCEGHDKEAACWTGEWPERKSVRQDETLLPKFMIEIRGKWDVFKILDNAGIQEGSQSFRDYSKAKKLLFGGLWIDSTIYDKQIRWVCDYLSL